MAYSIVYSPIYSFDIGPHVFLTSKYAGIRQRLLDDHAVPPDNFLEPEPAVDDQLLLVHTPELLRDIHEQRLTQRTLPAEMPLTREIADGFILFAGGSILAAREAMRLRGAGIHIGGGFHHAFPDHAEGFCFINDHSVAVRALQGEGLIERAFILDCDLHQGNGTAVVFENDDTVFTCSLHQENNYPTKQRSDLDFGLRDGADDAEYLEVLRQVVPDKLAEFKPDLLVYVAGSDPYVEDQLGGLALTIDGLRQRDKLILSAAARLEIPALIVLAGGYAQDPKDTVTIQTNTCLAAIHAFSNPEA